MSLLTEQVQTADWKAEKHVPVIECKDEVQADTIFQVKLLVGKEIAHPNTTEHHIRWIALFFQPEGDKFTYEVGRYEFNGHGESAQGSNAGPLFTDPVLTISLKVNKPGILQALSLCNIHGLWQSNKEIKLS